MAAYSREGGLTRPVGVWNQTSTIYATTRIYSPAWARLLFSLTCSPGMLISIPSPPRPAILDAAACNSIGFLALHQTHAVVSLVCFRISPGVFEDGHPWSWPGGGHVLKRERPMGGPLGCPAARRVGHGHGYGQGQGHEQRRQCRDGPLVRIPGREDPWILQWADSDLPVFCLEFLAFACGRLDSSANQPCQHPCPNISRACRLHNDAQFGDGSQNC